MFYLAALAAFGSVLCSRLLLAQLVRIRRADRGGASVVGALVWGALTGLCWWVLVAAPPFFLAVGIVLNVVWYGFEGAMALHERANRD